MPKVLSNFRKTVTPDFSRISTKSTIDTFFGIPKEQENAQSQIYTPNYEYLYQSASRVPKFDRILSREQKERSASGKVWVQPYDHEKVSLGYEKLSHLSKPPSVLLFDKIQGRDDKMLYRLAERPEEPVPLNVSHADFLPNSIKASPARRDFSHT